MHLHDLIVPYNLVFLVGLYPLHSFLLHFWSKFLVIALNYAQCFLNKRDFIAVSGGLCPTSPASGIPFIMMHTWSVLTYIIIGFFDMQIIGLFGTFTTLAIGYYFVYSEELSVGMCFIDEYPGIRRACLLDLTGSVMSILVSVLILVMQLFSAYLNRNDVSYNLKSMHAFLYSG